MTGFKAARQKAARRPVNLTLEIGLVAEARRLGINLSRAAQDGLEAAVRAENIRRFRTENRAAAESWNRYVEQNGIPLGEHRKF